MTNKDAIGLIKNMQKEFIPMENHIAIDIASKALEQMDSVKMVTDKDIGNWITNVWGVSETPNSNKSLAVKFARDHGILIEPPKVKKWIWFKVDKFTASRSNAHMSMAQMRELNIMGWSQDLSTEIEE